MTRWGIVNLIVVTIILIVPVHVIAADIVGFKSLKLGMTVKEVRKAISSDASIRIDSQDEEWWDNPVKDNDTDERTLALAYLDFVDYQNLSCLLMFSSSWKLFQITVYFPGHSATELRRVTQDVKLLHDALLSKFGTPAIKQKDDKWDADSGKELTVLSFEGDPQTPYYAWIQNINGAKRKIVIYGITFGNSYVAALTIWDGALQAETTSLKIEKAAEDF